MKRLWLLLGALAILSLAAGGVYFSRAPLPAVPAPPEINLEGADPEIARAIDKARAEIVAAPRSVPAWTQLAALSHANGFDVAADACYDAAMLLDEKDSTWPYLRGYLHLRGPGGAAAALPHFERAACLGRPSSLIRLRLAEALLELDRLDEAEERCRQVLKENSQDTQALLGLGKVAVARGKYEESLRFLVPIADGRFVQKQSCAMRASVYERLGRRDEAEREWQRLARLPDDQMRPDDPMQQVIEREIGLAVMMRKGQALWKQRQTDDVLALARDAVKRYPNSDVAWASLGNVLAATGDPDAAEQALTHSIQLAPKTAEHRLGLAKLQLERGNHQAAAKTLGQAIESNPRDGQAHFLLGECQAALENPDAAIQAYRATLRYVPDHAVARERLEKLGAGE